MTTKTKALAVAAVPLEEAMSELVERVAKAARAAWEAHGDVPFPLYDFEAEAIARAALAAAGGEGRRCASCKFFCEATCRKSPPVRLPRQFHADATATTRTRDETLLWGWPHVLPSDWCGEYTPLAASPAPAAAGGDGWRSIESAPKDGTRVWLCGDAYDREGYVAYDRIVIGYFHDSPVDGPTWYITDLSFPGAKSIEPKLWHPLPKHPSASPAPQSTPAPEMAEDDLDPAVIAEIQARADVVISERKLVAECSTCQGTGLCSKCGGDRTVPATCGKYIGRCVGGPLAGQTLTHHEPHFMIQPMNAEHDAGVYQHCEPIWWWRADRALAEKE